MGRSFFDNFRYTRGVLLIGSIGLVALLAATGIAAGLMFAIRLGVTPRDAVASAIWHCRIIVGAIVEAWETLFK